MFRMQWHFKLFDIALQDGPTTPFTIFLCRSRELGFFSIRCIVAYSSDIGACVYNLTLFLFILTILILVNQMYSYLLYVLCYNKAQTQNLVLSLPSLFDFPLYIHSSILFRWTSCGKDLLHFLWAKDLKEDISYF